MKAILVNGAVSVFLIVLALVIYERTMAAPARQVGIVDINEVYRLKEREFTDLIIKASSDEERRKAMSLAQKFSQDLPKAIAELPAECGCIVLLKAAVVASRPETLDLTQMLKRKLGAPT